MLEVEEKPMLDLYEHGNYVGSFETISKVKEFLEKESKRISYVSTEDYVTKKMNDRIFTVIRSSHLNFTNIP